MLARNFNDDLSVGRVAESRIARWLRQKRGCTVIPVYEIAEQQHKGPQVFSPDREVVAPDMIVYGRRGACFIEAKCKSVFTWWRKGHVWETGIDLRYHGQYTALRNYVPWPIHLLFLHVRSTPDKRDLDLGSPATCPTGLFGCDIGQRESHRDDRWGKDGMIYWAHDDLRLLARLEDVP